jgi:predicted DNA-binding transcriptional regulator YafY
MSTPLREVVIDYTNWRGMRSSRRIRPWGIRFGSNEWHAQEQWLLHALDIEKDEDREFALASIHSWSSQQGEV